MRSLFDYIKKSYSILQLQKFGVKLNFYQKGSERYASALTKMHLSNKVINNSKKKYK